MFKYELYEINMQYSYEEKLIAKSNDLEKLKIYAKENYFYNCLFLHCEVRKAENNVKDLFYYDNDSGSFHGDSYYPSAVIRLAEQKFIIIE